MLGAKTPRRASLSKLFSSSKSERSDSVHSADTIAPDEESKDCAIRVIVRARPLNERELLAKTPVIVNVTRTSVQVVNPIVFLDPTYQEAVSSRGDKAAEPSIALSTQGIAAATSIGECRTFNFDRCFGVDNPAANESEPFAHAYDVDFQTQRPNQELVFEEVGRDMITSAFQGFNCTVLAYGQTGSGKTHTMVGEKSSVKGKGLIPRVCEALFQEIDAHRAGEGSTNHQSDGGSEGSESEPIKPKTIYSAHISYCEIYKEKVNDLLDISPPHPPTPKSRGSITSGPLPASSDESIPVTSPTSRKALRVREHPVTGPFVEGLSSRSVTSYAEIAEEMLAGDKLRTVAATLMNPVSSRSHAVFTITFTQTTFDMATQCAHDKTSKICMIDLAGSERADVSGTSGDRLKEGAMINKSLSTLGRVISALSKQNSERIPYRDSTLTWLLKESLGGNAKTTMIAMISPSSENYEETMSTLRYAESAKKVINRAVVNEDKNARIIRQLRQEIEELRAQLATSRASPKRKASSAGLSASLTEREEFYQQLQKEVDFFRNQQQQLRIRERELLPSTAEDGVVRLPRVLPSLLNLNAGLCRQEDALAYILIEGVTVFGSQPIPLQSSIDCDSSTPQPLISQDQGARGSWSPTRFKKRLSYLSRAATTNTETKLAVNDNDGDNIAMTADPAVQYKLVETHGADVTAQHACFVCFRMTTQSVAKDALPEQPAAADGTEMPSLPSPSELPHSIQHFEVEVQALDENAVLKVNGAIVAIGDRKKLQHGDKIELGSSCRLRLNVPGSAPHTLPSLEDTILSCAFEGTVDNAECPGSPALPAAEHDNAIDLKAYIDEANSICQKLGLATEFELCLVDSAHSPVVGSSERLCAVAIKKKMGDRRYSTDNWNPVEFERQLNFLRDLAESFEAATGSNVERERRSHEALDSVQDTHELAEQSKRSEVRSPGNVESDALDVSIPSIEKATEDKDFPSTSVRLLGLGRIYSGAIQSAITSNGDNLAFNGGGPFPVAIYGFSGDTIGVLEIKIDRNPCDLPQSARRMSRSLSFRSPRASQTGRNITKSASIQIKIIMLRLKAGGSDSHSRKTWLTLKIIPDTLDPNTEVVSKRIRIHSATSSTTAEKGSMHSFELNGMIDLQTPSSIIAEVWGYTSLDGAVLQRQPVEPFEILPAQVGFYLSIDTFERESDGIYRPVPIKSDGTLRLTCGHARRLNIRLTQSDLFPFVLSKIRRIAISSPRRLDVTELMCDDIRLGPGNSVMKTVQQFDGIHHFDALEEQGTDCGISGDEGDSLAVESKLMPSWQTLQFRADSTVDVASRSVSAVLKWDQQGEQPDPDGKRSMYKVIVVLSTTRSSAPIIISKALVVKFSAPSVSASKRFKREMDISKSPWWTRDSFSRNFRLGTWYSADIPVSPSEGDLVVEEDTLDNQISDDSKLLASEEDTNRLSEDVELDSKINAHIKNSRRMELGLELERVRQLVWMMLRDGNTASLNSAKPGAGSNKCQDDEMRGPELMVDHVNAQLQKLRNLNQSASPADCLELPGADGRTALFLRFTSKPSIIIDLVDGSVASKGCGAPPSITDNASGQRVKIDTFHSGYYAAESSDYGAYDDENSRALSGYLMLSVSQSPDEAAAALVAPYPSRKKPVGRHSITKLHGTKESPKSWQRQWFVLRRPFLYAYESIERKVLMGVLDVSSCQVVAPPSSQQTSISAKYMPSSLSSSAGNGSVSSGRSWVMAEVPEGTGPGLMPFSFRLIKMSGASDGKNKARSVMWTLQASTAAEMQAWLAGIEPFKVQSTGAEANHFAISTGRSVNEEN